MISRLVGKSTQPGYLIRKIDLLVLLSLIPKKMINKTSDLFMPQIFDNIISINNSPDNKIWRMVFSCQTNKYGVPCIEFFVRANNITLQNKIKSWAPNPIVTSISHGSFQIITFIGTAIVLQAIKGFDECGNYYENDNWNLFQYIEIYRDHLNAAEKRKNAIIITPNAAAINLVDIMTEHHIQFFKYLAANTHISVWHQNKPYDVNDFTIALNNSLIKKAYSKKSSYYVVSEYSSFDEGGYGQLFRVEGKLKASTHTKTPYLFSYYPSHFTEKEQPKVVKKIKIEYPNEVALIQNEYEFMCAIASDYLNPKPLAYQKNEYGEVSCIYLFQNRFDGVNLKKFISNTSPYFTLPLNVLLQIADDLLNELKKCHEKGIVHRDIKPANIMINDRTYKPRLIDFGACIWEENIGSAYGIFGTSFYLAPEAAVERTGMQSKKMDYYSIGLVLLELFGDTLRQHIFLGKSDYHVYEEKRKLYYSENSIDFCFRFELVNQLGDQHNAFCNALKKLLATKPENRSLQEPIDELRAISEKLFPKNIQNLQPSSPVSTAADIVLPNSSVDKPQNDDRSIEKSKDRYEENLISVVNNDPEIVPIVLPLDSQMASDTKPAENRLIVDNAELLPLVVTSDAPVIPRFTLANHLINVKTNLTSDDHNENERKNSIPKNTETFSKSDSNDYSSAAKSFLIVLTLGMYGELTNCDGVNPKLTTAISMIRMALSILIPSAGLVMGTFNLFCSSRNDKKAENAPLSRAHKM